MDSVARLASCCRFILLASLKRSKTDVKKASPIGVKESLSIKDAGCTDGVSLFLGSTLAKE